MTPVRLVAAFAVVLLGCGVTVAQVETAPPPHPTLEEVAKEYRRLELPLPPPDAPLVRIKRMVCCGEEEGSVRTSYMLGFPLPPRAAGKDPRYLIGCGRRLWGDVWFDPSDVRPAEPTPDAFDLVFLEGDEWLCFAARCALRGWRDLAKAAYARSLERYADVSEATGNPLPSVIVELRLHSLVLLERRLDQPGADRKEIIKRLREKYAEEPELRTPHTEGYLRTLELTYGPRKSKPGTVEALIDDLIEYRENLYDPLGPTNLEPYWKLVELGFDAVPALIEHLGDERISHAYAEGSQPFSGHTVTVGDLCSRILLDLSARALPGHWELRGDRINAEKAREWFAAVQKIGEEKWLLSNAIAQGEPGPIVNERGRPERPIVRVIGAKYPSRLPDIYRKMLEKKPSDWNCDYVHEILASKLTREQKAALFEEGAGHEDVEHRTWALEGLDGVDRVLLRKHLLKTLKEVPARSEKGKPWFPNRRELLPLLASADDPDCWAALVAAAKQLPAMERLYMIRAFDPMCAPDEDDPIRKERLRFLLQFLDDRSTAPDDAEDWKGTEVGDYAATQSAGLLRIPVERLGDPGYVVQHTENRGPVSRFLFREAVRQVGTRELARGGE